MGKKILLVIGIMLLTCSMAYAAVENVKVSGDITTQAVARNLSAGAVTPLVDPFNEALGLSTTETPSDAQDFIFSQVRLKFDADLTEEVSATIRLINEKIWGLESTSTSDIDLDLAYVELKKFFADNITLTVGRQNLSYGTGLVVGDPDTDATAAIADISAIGNLSLRKSFDAIKIVMDYAPFVVDFVYAKVYEGAVDTRDDVTLSGVNIAYQWNSGKGLSELYFFNSQSAPTSTSQVLENQSSVNVVGARTLFSPIERITLSLESAYQFGDVYLPYALTSGGSAYGHLRAYAVQATIFYKLLDKYNTVFNLGGSILSGDDPTSKKYEGWNTMFENQSFTEIINMVVATNGKCVKIGGSFMPREDITLGANVGSVWLMEKSPDSGTLKEGVAFNYNSKYSPAVGPLSGTTYRTDNGDNYAGTEFDFYGVYSYTEDVQFKFATACLLPGEMFIKDNDRMAYSMRGGLTVNF